MKRYENCKDSGIEWIGEIPKHWELKKLALVASAHNGDRGTNYPSGEDLVENGIPFISSSELVDGKVVMDNSSHITQDKYQQLSGLKIQVGDIIYCLRGSVGKNGIADFNGGTIASSLMGIRSQNVIPRYLLYLLNSPIEEQQRHYLTTGSVSLNLSAENVMRFIFAFPPPEEQESIISYLDRKTAGIDALIADKQKLIELLKEKRQAVISEAVTKGLDPTVPMKDSGIEWIGKMPENWKIEKIKWIFELVKRPYFKEDRPVLSITQSGIKIKNINENDGQLAQTYLGYQRVDVNDFAMNGMDLLTGYMDCSKYDGVTSPDYRVFRFWQDKIQNYDYYKYLFQMYYNRKIFYKFGQGVSNFGRWRLQTETFLEFPVTQPPIDVQNSIARNIAQKTKSIDSLITNITNQIEKLKEYRQSVISEAVTGKVAI